MERLYHQLRTQVLSVSYKLYQNQMAALNVFGSQIQTLTWSHQLEKKPWEYFQEPLSNKTIENGSLHR